MSQLIIGWKQISVYLQCSARTAKRYHREFGMPILRFPTKTVAVDPDEVKKWLLAYNPETVPIHRPKT